MRDLASAIDNQRRSRIPLDYVLITLPTTMPALPEPRNIIQRKLLGDPPLSLTELEHIFRRIAADPRPHGVILAMRGLEMGLADLQSLRRSILRLREKGKRVICYAPAYSMSSYYVASAADTIILQPAGEIMTLGIRTSASYLHDSLQTIGVEVEAVAISPYKSALDSLSRSTISQEAREQIEWLLDSRYDVIVNEIAENRGVSADDVRVMIDTAPHLDHEALGAGYVDQVLNEEGIARLLSEQRILPLERAEKALMHWHPASTGQYVAMLSVTGMIVDGKSSSPPADNPIPILGEVRAGDLTVVQQVRQLMEDPAAAAVILYIDSGGGSATASEAMTSALEELARERPLVVFMNNVAASGGYYIATPARWIVAQPGTITGSIGVLNGKVITNEMYKKLRINRVEFGRGANSSLLSDSQPYTDEQREQIRSNIERIYDQFTQRVANSRGMTQEQVDAIGGGRVWTGQQALENGLVDSLGDLQSALQKARELANLSKDTPLVLPQFKGDPIGPKLATQAHPAALLRYLQSGVKQVFGNRPQMIMPVSIKDKF